MTLYLDIFKKSWSITKKNPVLWVFGVFVLFWGGRNLDFELVFSNAKLFRSDWSPFRPDFWDVTRWSAFTDKIAASTEFILPFIVIISALALFVLFMMIASHIGLIDAFATEKGKTYSFAQAITASEKHMGPVLGVQVLSKTIMYVLVGFASIPLFFSALNGWESIISAGVFVLVIPVVVIMSIVTRYTVIGIVADQKSVMHSLSSAWKIFQNNVGTSLEMALCMFVVFSAINLGSIVVAMLVLSPFFIGAIFVSVNGQTVLPMLMHSTLLSLISMLFMILSAVIFSAWHTGSWTLLYKEISVAPRRSKTHRLLKGKKEAA